MAQTRPGLALPQMHRLALESLQALAAIRTKEGNWSDDELEQEANATQSYKWMEALLCFLSAAPYPAIWPQIEQDTKLWLQKDIKHVFNLLAQDGFFASPYALVVEQKDQYVDFACDVLHFCCSIADMQPPNEKVIKDAEEWSRKAMELLTKEGFSKLRLNTLQIILVCLLLSVCIQEYGIQIFGQNLMNILVREIFVSLLLILVW